MSLLSRIMARLGRTTHEGDGRPGGSAHQPPTGDRHSTTGTTQSGTHVGRVAGEDAGYLDSGAEHRAEHRADEDTPPEST